MFIRVSSFYTPNQPNMANLNDIKFGNPCLRDHKMIHTENYLDRLIPFLKKYTPPENNSQATRAEINQLVNLLATPRNNDNNLYDEQLTAYIKAVFVNAGADAEEIQSIITDIANDVLPLITKLKFIFQRPRPATLAYYCGVPLHPDFSYFTNSPSYPSCHTALTAITCETLGNLYPESYAQMQKITATVRDSRLYLGVHYSSDNDMAMIVANKVLENPEFKLKRRL
jgi:hypothetical protein